MITDDFILKKLKNIDLSYKIAIAPYGKMGKRIENILLKTNMI